MQQQFIRKNNSDSLILLFLGYGQDEKPFMEYANKDAQSDLAIVYDYEDECFSIEPYEGYKKVTLIAWSMGVMMASLLLDDSHLPFVKKIAVNGTIEGIDDDNGISLTMWNATIDALSDSAILKFYRRMCGSRDVLNTYLEHKPLRDVDSMRHELIFIRDVCLLNKSDDPTLNDDCSLNYDVAYVGEGDRIFLPENQERSCTHNKIKVEKILEAHYPKALFDSLLK